MIYTGNHVFHYTKFESALKIIATGTLKFGSFENMNDIAEVKRDVYGAIPTETILKELANYQSISLTLDNASLRGFSIDSLWGHYAQNGNGVCLVFDKTRLEQNLSSQYKGKAMIAPISYLDDFSNAIFADGDHLKAVRHYIKKNIKDIFFTKSKDWAYEQELRIIKNKSESEEDFHYGEGALLAVILCLPKVDCYKTAPEFIVLKSLLPNTPILHYTTSLGNKELLNEDDEQTCNILGVDLKLDTK